MLSPGWKLVLTGGLLCGVVLGLRLIRVRPEVELVGGIRVEAGERIGV
jgi:hypothetical protein